MASASPRACASRNRWIRCAAYVSLCLQRGVPPLGQEPQREQRLTGQVADEHEVQAEQDQADVSDVLKVMDLHQRLGASLPGADRRQVPGVAEQRQPGCQRGQAPVDWCEERRLSVHNLWMVCAEQHLPSVHAEECWGFPARDSL
jgi:hypothetical protein